MWRLIPLVVMLPLASLGMAQVEDRPWLPSDTTKVAAAHLRTLPSGLRKYVRYLHFGCEWDDLELAKAVRVMNGHINQLSRRTVTSSPKELAGGRVLWFDVRDYGDIFATQYERLADADPYFHEPSTEHEVITWPGGTWRDGQHYDQGTFTWKRPKVALASVLSEGAVDDAEYLVNETQSRVPILAADWFFNQTAVQFKRTPGYYDMLGIKDESTFEKLIGLRKVKLRIELREAVAKSTVTHQPRGIVREEAEGGFRWRSIDFILAKGKQDPLENQGRGLDREADATEQYGTLPNYMPVTYAGNGKGVRQDFAPAEIASDTHSTSTDKKVHVNVSCLRCHAGFGQLQPIKAWFRNLTTPPLSGQFADKDTERAYRAALLFREQYGRKLETYLEKDRKVYDDAIREATGWGAQEYANNYAWMWERYEDAVVGAASAAQKLGVTIQRLRAAIDLEIRKTGKVNTTISSFLLEGERAEGIGIRQWESLYPKIQLTIRGYHRP